jgi:hypothetical protein
VRQRGNPMNHSFVDPGRKNPVHAASLYLRK